jgi:hypothetical protein
MDTGVLKDFVLKNENTCPEKYRRVYDSIVGQSVSAKIIEVFFSINNAVNGLKWKPLAKQYCKKLMDENSDFIVINDPEYLNINQHNYKDMKKFLVENKKYGAVSLYAPTAPPPEYGHICVGISMIRREAIKDITFDLYPKHSSCVSVSESLMRSSWKYGYIDTTIRCKKL